MRRSDACWFDGNTRPCYSFALHGRELRNRAPVPAGHLLLQIADVCGVPLQAFALSDAPAGQRTPVPPMSRDDRPSEATSGASATSAQALTLINHILQERPDVIPFVLELLAGFVEESPPS